MSTPPIQIEWDSTQIDQRKKRSFGSHHDLIISLGQKSTGNSDALLNAARFNDCGRYLIISTNKKKKQANNRLISNEERYF